MGRVWHWLHRKHPKATWKEIRRRYCRVGSWPASHARELLHPNVLAVLPKSAHPAAKKALAEIWNAEDRRHAVDAVGRFDTLYGAKFPKAVAKITDDIDELLAFYDYPAEHWIHLRMTSPIESTFRRCGTGPRSPRGKVRAAGLAMAFKLIEAAQVRWRAVNAPQLVALVRAGATFVSGKLVEQADERFTHLQHQHGR